MMIMEMSSIVITILKKVAKKKLKFETLGIRMEMNLIRKILRITSLKLRFKS